MSAFPFAFLLFLLTRMLFYCTIILPNVSFWRYYMKKLLLILLCVCAVFFIACGNDTPDSSSSVTSQTEEPPAPPEEVKNLDIIKDGVTNYSIVYSFDASHEARIAAEKLKTAISEKYGIDISTQNDIIASGEYEILIGSTERNSSLNALSKIGYLDSVIAMDGNSLVIAGNSDESTTAAVDAFIEKYMSADSLSLPENLFDQIKYDYPKPVFSIDGTPITEFSVLYTSGCSDQAASIADRIGRLCGTYPTVKRQTTQEFEGKYFLIGEKNASLGQYDFSIAKKDYGYSVSGGMSSSVNSACSALLKVLESDKTEITSSDIERVYTLPDRQEYINDISKFALSWELDFTVPEWMLDFDEKYAATMDPAGRLMSCLHRGDMVYYPENSIEGIISAIMMGGDMIEIDPRKTKDGVLVLVHDETLTRTTNIESMVGKNGLPNSYYVSDWTYDQLQQLNLRTGTGGSSAAVTPFKIPTLEEAIKVCANRIFIRLDVKSGSDGKIFWNYKNDIWPLIQKYNSYDNIIFTWHSFVYSNNYSLAKTYRPLQTQACGRPAPIFLKSNSSVQSLLSTVKLNGFDPCMRLGTSFGEYSYKTYLAENEAYLNSLKGKIRTYADVHGTNSKFPENKESHAFYGELYDAGITYLLVNKGLMLCQYIAENFEAAQYSK